MKRAATEPAFGPPAAKRAKKSASTPARSGTFQRGNSFAQTFQSILQHPPEPLDMPCMGAKHEQEQGSRRFVQTFPGTVSADSWHKEALKNVLVFRHAVTIGPKAPAPKEANVALARIRFFTEQGDLLEEKALPYFFVSGWPANGNRQGFRDLSSKTIKGPSDQSNSYGIRLITAEYEGGKETVLCDRNFTPFFEKMHGMMSKERGREDKILGDFRTGAHAKLTESSHQYPIQAKLYFHSEQAMRSAIQDAVEAQIKGKLVKPGYAIVDICSYYDMCWGCGDTLSAESHTSSFPIPVYFHASGEKPYFDKPFNQLGEQH